MAAAIEACVHCGFCLPACPTYQELGEEMDSPRGRIYLIKEVLEGRLSLDGAAGQHVDRCLGCLACVEACPSGVRYDLLLVGFREWQEARRKRSALSRWWRRGLLSVLPYPRRLRAAVALGRAAGRMRRWLPRRLRAMIDLIPPEPVRAAGVPPAIPTRGPRRARVALLRGCVESVLAPGILEAAVRVLTANGVEVVVPEGQGCCGALALHAGATAQARVLARRNLRAFRPEEVDAVLTTAAGCGSAMKAYPELFAGRPEQGGARAFSAKVRDISEFLDAMGVTPPSAAGRPGRVAYHDACHLGHAQGVRDAPRRLLSRMPGVELVEIPDGDTCCGSAGLYHLEHPELARRLQERKVEAILRTGAGTVVAGNIGCIVQIREGLARRGAGRVRVQHTVELLDRAYARPEGGGGG
ncbi:MAG: 4Fe-4S dicluster domain-containing protein [Limnochordaceae bacterium]|nr:4Fe-4S dicluster domain-containing protein [Limnochordaceae bacterium]